MRFFLLSAVLTLDLTASRSADVLGPPCSLDSAQHLNASILCIAIATSDRTFITLYLPQEWHNDAVLALCLHLIRDQRVYPRS
jgi:hypothetical protein